MTNKILILGAFFLLSSVSYSQEEITLESLIIKKEIELENSKTSSRSSNNSIEAELNKLYTQLKLQLENEIKTISDKKIKAIKREELKNLNSKIENYSQKK